MCPSTHPRSGKHRGGAFQAIPPENADYGDFDAYNHIAVDSTNPDHLTVTWPTVDVVRLLVGQQLSYIAVQPVSTQRRRQQAVEKLGRFPFDLRTETRSPFTRTPQDPSRAVF
jgi:hypothetical protein